MTREEAIKTIEVIRIRYVTLYEDERQALEMAIKALEQEPCEDAISRQAVLDLVESDWKYEGLETVIRDLPPVTPQPKTGHWIDREVYDADRWKCSECGRTEQYQENYCPNCGCHMTEPQESEGKE